MAMTFDQLTKPVRLQVRARKCLRCDKFFESKWCGNRLCEWCRRAVSDGGPDGVPFSFKDLRKA